MFVFHLLALPTIPDTPARWERKLEADREDLAQRYAFEKEKSQHKHIVDLVDEERRITKLEAESARDIGLVVGTSYGSPTATSPKQAVASPRGTVAQAGQKAKPKIDIDEEWRVWKEKNQIKRTPPGTPPGSRGDLLPRSPPPETYVHNVLQEVPGAAAGTSEETGAPHQQTVVRGYYLKQPPYGGAGLSSPGAQASPGQQQEQPPDYLHVLKFGELPGGGVGSATGGGTKTTEQFYFGPLDVDQLHAYRRQNYEQLRSTYLEKFSSPHAAHLDPLFRPGEDPRPLAELHAQNPGNAVNICRGPDKHFYAVWERNSVGTGCCVW